MTDVHGANRRVKVAIVGAGGHFTTGLLLGLSEQPGLRGAEVVLYDPNPAPLATLQRWGERLIEQRHSSFAITTAGVLQEALAGADFVFTTIRGGGGKAARADLEVPARHGIEQAVGDTVGPGGFAYALRQIPIHAEIAQTMHVACPDAWLLNFSNPMTAICRAVIRTGHTRCVGLCDGVFGRRSWLGHYLDVPEDELAFRHGGVNHLTWFTSLQRNGIDLYPVLRRRFQARGSDSQPVSFKLMEVFGLFPSPGDRHIAEFYPYFHRAEAEGGRAYGLPTSADRSEPWQRLEAEANGQVPVAAQGHGGAAAHAMALVAALSGAAAPPAHDKRPDPMGGLFAVNTPNRQHGEMVPDLPPWAVVEALARADADGLHPIPSGELPAGIAATLRARLDQQELTVEAALTGDRGLALQALAADPLVPSLEQAEAVLEELLHVQAAYLPRFA